MEVREASQQPLLLWHAGWNLVTLLGCRMEQQLCWKAVAVLLLQ